MVHTDTDALADALAAETGRGGEEERNAWRSSLPALADILGPPEFSPLHLFIAGHGHMALEYQLPAASSWCDVVLLGRSDTGPSALIVELKHWNTGGDIPGPAEGLMERAGQLVLHPADQVRGYAEYCRRFHSTVQDLGAVVRGCVMFTRDSRIGRYLQPPNDLLTHEYPCFSLAPDIVREEWPSYVSSSLDSPDEGFACAFAEGRYRQDRGFIRQIGAMIRDQEHSSFELLDHQRLAFSHIMAKLEQSVLGNAAPRKQVIVVEGPPGSGKSVIAAHIWSALATDARLPEGSFALTTTSASQTSNWVHLFETAGAGGAGGVVRRASSYSPISTTTIGRLRRRYGASFAADPSEWRRNVQLLHDRGVAFQDGAADEQFLVSVVDEAHALINPEHSEGRGQFGFPPSLGPLAWQIIRCSTMSIFLLDPDQGFRDRENTTLEDIRRWADELGAEVEQPVSLAGAQFRCAGSSDYMAWLDGLLMGREPRHLAELAGRWRDIFDVKVHETPAALEHSLRTKQAAGSTVRLHASYAREWKTKGAARPHRLPASQQDFYEQYYDESGRSRHWSKVWNFVPNTGQDYTWFIQAPAGSPMHEDQLCEVGCPYAVRGFDFDCIGVLWLGDLIWRDGRWLSRPAHVYDTGLSRSAGAARKEREPGPAHEQLRSAVSRAYRILLSRGMSACHLWFEDDQTRDHVCACLGLSIDDQDA